MPDGFPPDAAHIAVELPAALATRSPAALEPLLDVIVRWAGEARYARPDVLDFYWQAISSGVTIQVHDIKVVEDCVLLRAWVGLPTGDSVERQVQLTVRDGLVFDVR